MNMIEGSPSGEGRRFGLVVARFNHFVTEPLLEGAVAGLKEHGVRDEPDRGACRGPLSFRPWPCALQPVRRHCHRGGDPGNTALDTSPPKRPRGPLVSMQTGLPVAFGILTCDTVDQAVERAGEGASNKGWEAAAAALEMADLNARLGAAGL